MAYECVAYRRQRFKAEAYMNPLLTWTYAWPFRFQVALRLKLRFQKTSVVLVFGPCCLGFSVCLCVLR